MSTHYPKRNLRSWDELLLIVVGTPFTIFGLCIEIAVGIGRRPDSDSRSWKGTATEFYCDILPFINFQ